MFIQRFVFTPALGKGPEMRALLTARAQSRQAAGGDIALARAAFPTPQGPQFFLNLRFADLTALEAQSDRNATDAGFGEFLAKVNSLAACNVTGGLAEVLTAPLAGPAPRYTQRVVFHALPGRLPELRDLWMERVRERQAQGARGGLSVSVGGEEGPELIQIALFESLKDFESARRTLIADPVAQAFVQRTSALLMRPPSIQLSEVLVPFKP